MKNINYYSFITQYENNKTCRTDLQKRLARQNRLAEQTCRRDLRDRTDLPKRPADQQKKKDRPTVVAVLAPISQFFPLFPPPRAFSSTKEEESRALGSLSNLFFVIFSFWVVARDLSPSYFVCLVVLIFVVFFISNW
jgi:hypothetical protein